MAAGNIAVGSNTANAFVLANVPDIDDDKEGLLNDYLEATLPENIDVERLTFHPAVSDRVLIELKEKIDKTFLKEVASSISEQPLGDQVLKVELAEAMNAVIAVGKELNTKLTPFFLKLYFQSEFGDSYEIVTNVVEIPMSSEFAVHFTKDEVTRGILEQKTHIPLPSKRYEIQVKPFFSNFHGLIEYKGSTLLNILEKLSISQQQSEDPAIQQEIFFDATEKEPSEADLGKDYEMISDDEVREMKVRTIQESTETSVPVLNDQASYGDEDDRNSRDNKGFHSQDREMIKKPPSTDHGKGQREHVSLYPKLNEEKSPDDKRLPHDHQNEVTLTAKFQSLSVNDSSNTGRNAKSPDIAPASKPEDNTKKEKDKIFSLTLNKAQWKLMSCKIKRENNEMDYDEEKETLSVRGQNIDQFMKSFADLKDRVKECHIPLDEDRQLVLKSEYAKTHLTIGLHDVEWIIDRGYIEIYGLGEWYVNYVKDKVNGMIGDIERITIPNNVSDEDLKQCISHFEMIFPVHISSDDHSITIIGKKDCMSIVKKDLESKSKGRSQQEQGWDFHKSSVQFSVTHYNLLMIYHASELDAILKNVKYAWEKGTEGKAIIEFNGSLGDVRKAEEDLKTLPKSIKTEVIDVLGEFDSTTSLHLIQGLSSLGGYDPIFAVQKSFEVKHKCIINNVVKTATSPQATGSTQHHGRVPKKTYAGAVNHENQQSSFQVNSSVQLEIKSYGDIVKEQSDVLVCVLPEHKKLSSTFVGRAFCEALPGLEDMVNNLDFSFNKVAFMATNLLGSQRVRLAFVILPVYPDIPSLRKNVESSFKKSVVEVLHGASQFGARSVCFPPLGHGKMMKYPESFISEHFLSALKYYSDTYDTRLRKITFLSPDKDLYKKMTSNAPAYFASVPKGSGSSGYDDSFAMVGKNEYGNFGIQDKNVLIQIVHRNSYDTADIWKSKLNGLTSFIESRV